MLWQASFSLLVLMRTHTFIDHIFDYAEELSTKDARVAWLTICSHDFTTMRSKGHRKEDILALSLFETTGSRTLRLPPDIIFTAIKSEKAILRRYLHASSL